MEKEFDKTADAQVWDSGSQKLRRDTEREAVLALTMITEQISQVCSCVRSVCVAKTMTDW